MKWKLNYAWGARHWKLGTDVMLQADLQTERRPAVQAALDTWLKAWEPGQVAMDGQLVDCVYAGGAWVHRGEGPGLSVCLHSSGEDAFDSLSWCADSLVDALWLADPKLQVRWIEHPHRRKTQRCDPA